MSPLDLTRCSLGYGIRDDNPGDGEVFHIFSFTAKTNNLPLRYLELGDFALQSHLNVLLCPRGLSWFKNNASPDDFSILRIFDSKADSLGNATDAKQSRIYLKRRDLFSAAVDKFLEPPRQLQMTRKQEDTLVSRPRNNAMR